MTVRIAVVGVGFGTTVHVPAFQSEGLEVVAIAARRRERAEAAAAALNVPQVFTDFDELLGIDGLDAVSIVTPPRLHHEMAIAALRAGKHVICEKPFALNEQQAIEMVEEADRSGVTAMVAHEFRYASGRMFVHQLLEDGYIGTPKYAHLRLFRGPTKASALAEYRTERDSQEAGGGFLYSPASHYIDGLRHWFGEVESVVGNLIAIAPERVHDGKEMISDGDDTLSFTLNFASGVVAEMVGSKVTPFSEESLIAIYGTGGTLVTPQVGFNPPAHGEVLGARLGRETELTPIAIPSSYEPFIDDRDDRMMPFRLFVRDFLRGIETGTSPSPSFLDGLACQQVLDALRRSSIEGRRIAIAQ